MRSFGLKATTIKVLKEEFGLARSVLDEGLIDRCVKAGGNQYDMALQYIIAQSTEADREQIALAKELCAMATNPDTMLGRLNTLISVNGKVQRHPYR
ncbi:hypothetical protein [Sphingomonas sp. LY160]|uniref:hypothetical protein n=1 Tax=Sphingomonas sp. LY160 TaxID=3095342 RepID=UPI002ADEB818|nr:hypothetical protein [Sphingomonas sp. LY160]MEA1071766.1 hypothetical protein [Sphingomonas sp. LY160]